MKPSTKQSRQHARDEGPNSCLASPVSVPNWQQESRVVVLGVMYPNAFSRHPDDTTDDAQHLPSAIVSDRQSAAVIFHDPISSPESGDLTEQHVSGRTKNSTQERRHRNAPKNKPRTAEAIEAVAQELRRLLQERQTGTSEESHGMD